MSRAHDEGLFGAVLDAGPTQRRPHVEMGGAEEVGEALHGLGEVDLDGNRDAQDLQRRCLGVFPKSGVMANHLMGH